LKVIIAGSRSITDYETVAQAIKESGFSVSEVVSGLAVGPDTFGKWWAEEQGVPIIEFPAEWKIYGKRAGYLRNEEMAQYADALVAVWDGKSPGTKHMIDIARRAGLEVFVKTVE
jgi:hypothetical protein